MGYFSAGVLAASGTMLAIFHRDLSGHGQHVDASMQQAMSLGGSGMPLYDMLGQVMRRGEMWQRGRGAIRSVFPCKDGYVYFIIAVGTTMEAVRDLLVDEGLGEEFDPEWLDVNALRQNLPESRRFEELLARFFARYTKREVLEKCFNRKDVVFSVPTDTPKDVVESPQLKARGFFQEVEHPELGKTIRYPGAPYKLPESPWGIPRRAPLTGEHNQEVYEGVLGLSTAELARLRERGVI
jgi:crotonobetainyl-CoA:carnitine CoA-transferase CaiB-like acyl-CoA transferase